jgi:hypothetical protein
MVGFAIEITKLYDPSVKKYFKVLVALLLLPVCIWGASSLYTLMMDFQRVPEGSLYFSGGFCRLPRLSMGVLQADANLCVWS